MLRLLCGENNLEYTGNGYLQCGRHVDCPKKLNNKILGFDCIAYIDNLPKECNINIPKDNIKDEIGINADVAGDDTEKIGGQKTDKPLERISRTIEYVIA